MMQVKCVTRLITYDMSLRVEQSNHFGLCDYFTLRSLRTLRENLRQRHDKYLAGS
ncbi:hypothetical protein [Nostoc sp.]|uniref:hypothetical protein n=1 Tax=Nostoc sp. TaxID=1180 RepID=UPI002FFAD322